MTHPPVKQVTILGAGTVSYRSHTTQTFNLRNDDRFERIITNRVSDFREGKMPPVPSYRLRFVHRPVCRRPLWFTPQKGWPRPLLSAPFCFACGWRMGRSIPGCRPAGRRKWSRSSATNRDLFPIYGRCSILLKRRSCPTMEISGLWTVGSDPSQSIYSGNPSCLPLRLRSGRVHFSSPGRTLLHP